MRGQEQRNIKAGLDIKAKMSKDCWYRNNSLPLEFKTILNSVWDTSFFQLLFPSANWKEKKTKVCLPSLYSVYQREVADMLCVI